MLNSDFKQRYIVLDFETEDLNLVWTKPWQVSWVVTSLGEGVISEKDYFLKWPDLKMSESARKITNFDDAKYERLGVDPKVVLEELDKLIYDPSILIVGQNILNFDIYVHNVLRQLCGKSTDYSYIERVIDTKLLSKAKNSKVAFSGNRYAWQCKVESLPNAGKNSQLAMLKEHGIPFDESKLHDSLYDVTMTWEIYKKLIWMVEI